MKRFIVNKYRRPIVLASLAASLLMGAISAPAWAASTDVIANTPPSASTTSRELQIPLSGNLSQAILANPKVKDLITQQILSNPEVHDRIIQYLKDHTKNKHNIGPVGAPNTPSTPENTQNPSTPVEAPNTDSTPVEAPNTDSTPVEAPNTDSTPVEAPNTDSTPVEAPNTDSTPVEAQNTPSMPVSQQNQSNTLGSVRYPSRSGYGQNPSSIPEAVPFIPNPDFASYDDSYVQEMYDKLCYAKNAHALEYCYKNLRRFWRNNYKSLEYLSDL
jgi:hypothetical protein